MSASVSFEKRMRQQGDTDIDVAQNTNAQAIV
jgi:hypothetical protein